MAEPAAAIDVSTLPFLKATADRAGDSAAVEFRLHRLNYADHAAETGGKIRRNRSYF